MRDWQTQTIIAVLKKIAVHLESLRQHPNLVNPREAEITKGKRPDYEVKAVQQQPVPPSVNVSVSPEIKFPKAIENEYAAGQAEQERWNARQFGLGVVAAILSGLTLIALIVYASFTYGQLCEMIKANKISTRALNEVQRALVSLDRIDGTGLLNRGTIAEWQFIPKWGNGGTTAAKTMFTHINSWSGPTDLPTGFIYPDMWTTGVPHVPYQMAIGPKGTVGGPPTVITHVSTSSQRNASQKIECQRHQPPLIFFLVAPARLRNALLLGNSRAGFSGYDPTARGVTPVILRFCCDNSDGHLSATLRGAAGAVMPASRIVGTFTAYAACPGMACGGAPDSPSAPSSSPIC